MAQDRIRNLSDEEATLSLGAEIARAMPATDSPLVLYLQGELGMGKTTLARGLLRELGETGPVRSPSYALLAGYTLERGPVWHLDLYRLQQEQELEALALRDLVLESCLWLIEWPERAEHGLPAPDLILQWDLSAQQREVRMVARSEPGRQWLAGVNAGPSS